MLRAWVAVFIVPFAIFVQDLLVHHGTMNKSPLLTLWGKAIEIMSTESYNDGWILSKSANKTTCWSDAMGLLVYALPRPMRRISIVTLSEETWPMFDGTRVQPHR